VTEIEEGGKKCSDLCDSCRKIFGQWLGVQIHNPPRKMRAKQKTYSRFRLLYFSRVIITRDKSLVLCEKAL
jgi:hypothetical protein